MKTNNFDDDDLRAFVLNESRISTDDRDLDEFEPSVIFDLEPKMTKGGSGANVGLANGYTGGGSPIYIPRRGKFKGYMRENKRK